MSLLPLNSPYQMHKVLLFVCSKMADETNLSFKLLLQKEQERSQEESSVGDGNYSSGFQLNILLLSFTDSFASYSLAPLLMRPRHYAQPCAICSHESVGMLKSLREALRVSLYCFFRPP